MPINDRDSEELSAFLDGEATDPARIAARIEADPELARVFDQMRTVSAHVRAITPPEPPSAFLDGVLRRVEEERARTPVVRAARFPWRIPVALAAAATLLVSLGWWAWQASAPISPPPEPPPVAAMPAWEDDQAVLEALAELAEEGEDLSIFDSQFAMMEGELGEADVDDLLVYLASAISEEEWAGEDAVSGAPLSDVERLNEQDIQVLEQCISDAAHGGELS